jgi:hypothetical protein
MTGVSSFLTAPDQLGDERTGERVRVLMSLGKYRGRSEGVSYGAEKWLVEMDLSSSIWQLRANKIVLVRQVAACAPAI